MCWSTRRRTPARSSGRSSSALVDEFFAGGGARATAAHGLRGRRREAVDLLVPGRGAARVRRQRPHFERLHTAGAAPLRRNGVQASFRSAPIVLTAVDTVFAAETRIAASPPIRITTVHKARAARPRRARSRSGTPSRRTERARGKKAWDAPFDTRARIEPGGRARARGSPARVRRWCDGQGRPAGRRADPGAPARRRCSRRCIRALKNAGIAVAGADRLLLTEHIAVMDLMVLADALLLPRRRSRARDGAEEPAVRPRRGGAVHARLGAQGALLRARAQATQPARDLPAQLDRCARSGARDDAVRVLRRSARRRAAAASRFLARLGLEAIDALDEFLNLALDYERRETPSLQGFVAWLRAAQTEVKRDMEMARDEVRVMTVHGAKGLEAPIVILADTTTPPQGGHPPRLLQASAQARPAAAGLGQPQRRTTSARWARRARRRSARRTTNTGGCSMSR